MMYLLRYKNKLKTSKLRFINHNGKYPLELGDFLDK